MTYDNTNRGTIAKNGRKTEEKHPDITGSINVDGKDYWLNGWQKHKDGSTFYSLSVKPKEARQPERKQGQQEAPPADFSDLNLGNDDLPF